MKPGDLLMYRETLEETLRDCLLFDQPVSWLSVVAVSEDEYATNSSLRTGFYIGTVGHRLVLTPWPAEHVDLFPEDLLAFARAEIERRKQ